MQVHDIEPINVLAQAFGEGFVDQVGRLLDDPALGRRIGASARELVVSRYSWKAAVDRLTAFYDELLAARAAAR